MRRFCDMLSGEAFDWRGTWEFRALTAISTARCAWQRHSACLSASRTLARAHVRASKLHFRWCARVNYHKIQGLGRWGSCDRVAEKYIPGCGRWAWVAAGTRNLGSIFLNAGGLEALAWISCMNHRNDTILKALAMVDEVQYSWSKIYSRSFVFWWRYDRATGIFACRKFLLIEAKHPKLAKL
jgi:hypothetical protein